MQCEWSRLPLLPLNCVLEHLSTEDALAAMSSCRLWRTAVLLYEGHKETLKLRARQFEKSLFLTRIFKKHVKNLHVYLDGNESDLEKLMDFILPQFLETENLEEITVVGPSYNRPPSQNNRRTHVVKLKRIVMESLLFKHRFSLTRLALLGCAVDNANNDNDFMQKSEYNSRLLKYSKALLCGDDLLYNYQFMALQHLILDFEQLSSKCLPPITNSCLSQVTLNVNKRPLRRLPTPFLLTSQVAVNVINIPYSSFGDVIEHVLVEGLPLVSLKVMFCDGISSPLIKHVVGLYKHTLRQLVCVDRPRNVRDKSILADMNSCHVNPFILLCWQCTNLRRLVIHGYWLWQYDLLGIVRLSNSLQHLEVSSVYSKQRKQLYARDITTFRVLTEDSYCDLEKRYIDQINKHTNFTWSPIPWNQLPLGLTARATPGQRTSYVINEILDDSSASLPPPKYPNDEHPQTAPVHELTRDPAIALLNHIRGNAALL